jgi:hypothetical protein
MPIVGLSKGFRALMATVPLMAFTIFSELPAFSLAIVACHFYPCFLQGAKPK